MKNVIGLDGFMQSVLGYEKESGVCEKHPGKQAVEYVKVFDGFIELNTLGLCVECAEWFTEFEEGTAHDEC